MWRDAGRQSAGSRDQTVLLQTFNKIVADLEVPREDAQCLRAHLSANGAGNGSDVETSVGSVLVLLDDAAERIGALAWPEDADALAKGLKRSQARLRKSWKAARKTAEPMALHDWRKRVKDQAALLRLLRRVAPAALRSRHGEEKKTAELLGEEHDCWMLGERLAEEDFPAQASTARDALLAAIGDRRAALRDEAFKRGKAFSSQKAKAFARELTAAWEKACARANGKGGSAERRAISQAS
jgi:hypothetical protein